MNQQQIDQMKQHLEKIKDFNLSNVLASQHPNTDLNSLHYGEMSATELVALTDRMVVQFFAELNNLNGRWLPHSYQWETPRQGMSQRTVLSVLQNFTNYLIGKNWDAASQMLELLIGYQMSCGFWDRGDRKLHNSSRLQQKQLFADLELKSEQLTKIVTNATTHNNNLTSELQARRAESQQMTQLLEESNKQLQQLNQLLNQASGADGRVAQILTNQETNLEHSKTELQSITEQKLSLEKMIQKATEHLAACEVKLGFMQEKEAFVNEIAGTAGAGLLGQKFEARKKELSKSSNWWIGGFILSLIVSAVWLGLSHKYFQVGGNDIWLVFVTNFGLLVPVVFLLGFVARQYAKERHFQEEYAFRSSVAMTLTAFADQLTEADNARDALIRGTVEKLYRMPTLLDEKEKSPSWFQMRAVRDSINAAVELVKEVRKP